MMIRAARICAAIVLLGGLTLGLVSPAAAATSGPHGHHHGSTSKAHKPGGGMVEGKSSCSVGCVATHQNSHSSLLGKITGTLGGAACTASPIVCGAATAGGSKIVGAAAGVAKTLASWTPSGVIDQWAKSLAVAAVGKLSAIQTVLLSTATPHVVGGWFSPMYGVMLGMGIVAMAVALTVATGKLSRGGPEAAMLAKDAWGRAFFFMPVVTLAPGAIALFAGMVIGLSKWFGNSASAKAHSAITAFNHMMDSVNAPTSQFQGGTTELLVVSLFIFLGAFFAWLEISLSSYGVYICTLLFPVLFAISVYPPWRRMAQKLTGVLIGLLIMPLVVFFGFWVLWGAAHGLTHWTGGTPAQRSGMLSVVCVAACVTAIVPWMLYMLMPHVSPEAHALTSPVSQRSRATAHQTSRQATNRIHRLVGNRGGGGSSRRRPSAPPRTQQNQQQNQQSNQSQQNQKAPGTGGGKKTFRQRFFNRGGKRGANPDQTPNGRQPNPSEKGAPGTGQDKRTQRGSGKDGGGLL